DPDLGNAAFKARVRGLLKSIYPGREGEIDKLLEQDIRPWLYGHLKGALFQPETTEIHGFEAYLARMKEIFELPYSPLPRRTLERLRMLSTTFAAGHHRAKNEINPLTRQFLDLLALGTTDRVTKPQIVIDESNGSSALVVRGLKPEI